MAPSRNSSDDDRRVYRGDVVITRLDPDRLAELEEDVEEITELEDDEALYVSPRGEDGLEVMRLREDTESS